MAGFVKPLAYALACLSCGQGALAQERLPDPTRPALEPGTRAPSARDGETEGTRLETILISRQRKVAVIGGKTYLLGQKVGDANLVAINETSVVLEQGGQRQVLQLYPALRKTPGARAPVYPARQRAGEAADKPDKPDKPVRHE